jgi:hypothetical protein
MVRTMFKRLHRLLMHTEWKISLWNALFGAGGILSFGIPAWAASASDWLATYGPIGWVGAGFLGLLIFCLAAWLWSLARIQWFRGTVTKAYAATRPSVNPLEDHFINQRIFLNDFVSPYQNIVKNKTFTDCHVFGPMNIVVSGGSIQSSTYDIADHVIIKSDGMKFQIPANAVIFQECHFIRCAFLRITFLVLESMFEEIERGGGTNWITRTP